jgi:hypothetical protein
MSHVRCSAIVTSVSTAGVSQLNCGGFTAQQDIEFRIPRAGTPLLLPVQTRMAATRSIWHMIFFNGRSVIRPICGATVSVVCHTSLNTGIFATSSFAVGTISSSIPDRNLSVSCHIFRALRYHDAMYSGLNYKVSARLRAWKRYCIDGLWLVLAYPASSSRRWPRCVGITLIRSTCSFCQHYSKSI